MLTNILYFEKVTPEIKNIFDHQNIRNYKISYWSEMDETEKNTALTDADYFLVVTTKITKEIILKAKRLRMIQRAGVGVDNIDLKTAYELGIPVCNTPGGNSTAVAELTIGMILSIYRKLNILDITTKRGDWLMWELRHSSFEMRGKVHGVIGMGNIGKEVAKLSKAFGTKIVYFDIVRLSEDVEQSLDATYLALNELLSVSDIVSLHLPLVEDTRNLISLREFDIMKKNCVLINVSRGNIVDENALTDALTKRKIAGAGIDTWSVEPVKKENILLKFDNVLATPHIGSGTKDTFENLTKLAFNNFSLVDQGDNPRFVVNNVKDIRRI